MSKKREHHKLFMVGSDAPFQFTEAYKSLRTNLEFLAATSDCKTILITSSVPGEGKSNVAVNLAITLADSGKRVVLVDCDMRKSTISRYLHIPRDHIGITNTITGKDRTQLANALTGVFHCLTNLFSRRDKLSPPGICIYCDVVCSTFGMFLLYHTFCLK